MSSKGSILLFCFGFFNHCPLGPALSGVTHWVLRRVMTSLAVKIDWSGSNWDASCPKPMRWNPLPNVATVLRQCPTYNSAMKKIYNWIFLIVPKLYLNNLSSIRSVRWRTSKTNRMFFFKSRQSFQRMKNFFKNVSSFWSENTESKLIHSMN